ncbi:MAG: lipid-binding SYLF domain-containing protein [Candidatus Scalinduaceae bacterium]
MKFVLLIIICFVLITPDVYAVSKKKLNERIERANNYLEEIMETPDTAIPSLLLKKCYGVVIIRQYKAGFIFGVKGGKGVALKKDKNTGKWSAPSFVTSAEGSFGLQIGGQLVDAILLIMNKSGIESMLKLKCKLGVDASIAAGPVGRDADAKIGPDTAFLVYARAKGLYGGLTFEGGIITQDNGANEKFYGKEVTVKEIFDNEADMPDEAKKLIKTLEKYCNVTE